MSAKMLVPLFLALCLTAGELFSLKPHYTGRTSSREHDVMRGMDATAFLDGQGV